MARKRRTYLILAGLGLVGAAIALSSRKSSATATLGRPGHPDITKPGPRRVRGPLPQAGVREILEAPPDYTETFANYQDAVDVCVERGVGTEQPTAQSAELALQVCAMDEMFPDHTWPPPPQAHTWQRNLWFDEGLKAYVREKFVEPGVPG